MTQHSDNATATQASSSRLKAAGITTTMLLPLLPSLAQAHSGHVHSTIVETPSFLGTLQSGLLHPVTGLDHLFLAVGMGVLFYGLQKQRLGVLPLTTGLSLGAVVGSVGAWVGAAGLAASTGLVEGVILLSVVVLAIMLMSQSSRQEAFSAKSSSLRSPSIQQLSVVGFGGLAIFHGIAHAIEVPANVGVGGQLGFYAGMMVSMLMLYTIGTLVGQQLQQRLGGGLWLQRGLVMLGLGAIFAPMLG